MRGLKEKVQRTPTPAVANRGSGVFLLLGLKRQGDSIGPLTWKQTEV